MMCLFYQKNHTVSGKNLCNGHQIKSHNRSYLQTKYLHQYTIYSPVDILNAVYRSIKRFMQRPDYQKYWERINHQKRSVDKFYELSLDSLHNSIPTAIEYLTKESIPNKNEKPQLFHNDNGEVKGNRYV